MRRGYVRINSSKQVPYLVSSQAESQQGASSKAVSVEKPRDVVTNGREMERKAPGSPAEGRNLVPTVRDDLAQARAEMVERSHKAWIEKISRSRKGSQ